MNTDLIKKALLGECSKDELEEVRKFLNSKEGEDFISEHFESHNVTKENILNNLEEENLLSDIHNRINIEELLQEISKESEQKLYKSNRDRLPYRGSQIPGYKRSTRKRSAYLAAISFIIVLTTGYLINFINDINSDIDTNEITWIEKSTERGQQLTIRLVDGTQVILNANSSIRYPELFDDSVRLVEINGEAFFEVAHNASQPFVVDAGLIMSKVLGTTFNVVNNPERGLSSISLVTGKVEVTQKTNQEKLILAPGEAASTNEENRIEKSRFDIEKAIAWKDKIIFFSGENYPEVFDYLENWYGVNITVTNSQQKLISWKLNAKFENETLENILDALSESHAFSYNMEGRNVTVKF